MKRFFSPSGFNTKDLPNNDLPSLSTRPSLNVKSSANLLVRDRTEVKKKVGRYYYLESEEIGKGYTSSVYKAYSAEDIDLSKPRQVYAIKVMPLNFANSSSLELLENEIQILKLVDHPNIIKCYDIYKSKTHCYIITEFCPEGCLSDLINKNKSSLDRKTRLNYDKVVDIGQQIAEGLKYLFQRGIIHRDIKPANILKGKNGWKIADFGFAIFSNAEIKSRFNVGTPLYMPIESLKQNIYSPQSDIFSVGVILYQLSTGTTPWQSKSEKQLIRKMEIIPLQNTSGKSKIPSQLFKLIQRLCESRTRHRMTQQQFMNLQISKFIKSEQQQPKSELFINDWNKELKSIRSEISIQRKLKPIKSMEQIPFLYDRQRMTDRIDLNMILEEGRMGKRNVYKVPSIAMVLQQRNQNEERKLNSYGSKQEVFSSIRNRYFDIPTSGRPSLREVQKNDFVRIKQQLPAGLTQNNIKLSTKRFDLKLQEIKKEEHTRCTEKESDNSFNPESDDQKYFKQELNYIDQVSHIFLSQIHFCRFLFYLYRNSLYILLGKKSQDKLAALIFQMIFTTLDALKSVESSTQRYKNKSIPLLFKDKKFRTYLKSDKHELIRQTINQYKEKYEKQYFLLKIKLGQSFLDELQMEQKLNAIQMSIQSSDPQGQLIFVKRQLKQYLKQFDHNLFLAMDTFTGSQKSLLSPRYGAKNGFIAANVEGLRNLFEFYKLTTLMMENERDIEKFEKFSKISVNTNYAKNGDYSIEQLRKMRDLIKSL